MSEVLIYETESGQARVDVRLDAETVWLTQEQMAALFGRERSVVTKHLRNVFKEGELDEKSNVQNLHIAGSDKPVKFYNLDIIISIGYRVKSLRGTQFRLWATRTLREHLVQGYTLNQSRLAERGIAEAQQAVELMARGEATPLFGQARGEAFEGILGNIEQSMLGSFCIAPAKKKRRTCCISSSRIIRSRMATSVSAHSCSCSISSRRA